MMTTCDLHSPPDRPLMSSRGGIARPSNPSAPRRGVFPQHAYVGKRNHSFLELRESLFLSHPILLTGDTKIQS
jgi:hypothetical protein